MKDLYPDDIGMKFHTALRKVCDSTVTVLAYNLIHLENFDEVWEKYFLEVYEELKKLSSLQEDKEVLNILKKVCKKNLRFNSTHEEISLKLVFELFTEEEWKSIAEYIKDTI